MRSFTNEELKKLGWKWALRFEGKLMALTISPFDAVMWQKEGVGDVINLQDCRCNDVMK